MGDLTDCIRCTRDVEVALPDDPFEDDDGVICGGCLTSAEDVDETEAFVSLVARHATLGPYGVEGAAVARAAVGAALENLRRRLMAVPHDDLGRSDA